VFDTIEQLLPVEWRGAYHALSAPLRWIPEWQMWMLRELWYGSTVAEVVLERTLVLLPATLLIVGMWTTMLSLYTLPFRSGRGGFVTSLLMSWWDAGRMVWMYWSGFVRVGWAIVGWIYSLTRFGLRLFVNTIKGLFNSPLALLDWTSRSYFKPGMPWVAFLVLLLWTGVEATIFTFTLRPTLSEVLAGMTGFEPNPAVMAPLLFIFLFLLVAGSFACIQVMGEAITSRKVGGIVQMAVVESAVMLFEVMFLYRELIDSITPWIAQASGGEVQLGLASVLLLAGFGWMGVRGMTWFLFGRFGTPALIAILSRETIDQGSSAAVPMPVQPDYWREPINALKAETAWFKQESREFFELLTLPVLQLLACAVNFAVVVVQSRPVFPLPFRHLDDMLASTPFSHREDGQSSNKTHGRPTPIRPLTAVGS
jgi:hypothetical protein